MRPAMAILVLACIATTPNGAHAQGAAVPNHSAAHKSALHDAKWLVGWSVIALAQSADAASTCKAFADGGHELNPLLFGVHSCKEIAGFEAAGFVAYTALHLWAHKASASDDRKWYRAWGYAAVPAVVGIVHGHAAAHNYNLPDRPPDTEALARIGYRSE
jgi:hypothetical protein